MRDRKTSLWKSVESLGDLRKAKSGKSSRRELLRKLKTIPRMESEENQLGSLVSLSPSTPDKLRQLQPDSPTRGLGQWSKGRSSSIATTAIPVILFPMRWNSRPRRFSVDSQFPRQRMMKMFLKDRKVSLDCDCVTVLCSVPTDRYLCCRWSTARPRPAGGPWTRGSAPPTASPAT